MTWARGEIALQEFLVLNQYFWHGADYMTVWGSIGRYGEASLVAQLVRTCLPMQETQEIWVQSLGQEDSLEKEMATPSSILGEFHGQRSLFGYILQMVRLDWAHTHHHGAGRGFWNKIRCWYKWIDGNGTEESPSQSWERSSEPRIEPEANPTRTLVYSAHKNLWMWDFPGGPVTMQRMQTWTPVRELRPTCLWATRHTHHN